MKCQTIKKFIKMKQAKTIHEITIKKLSEAKKSDNKIEMIEVIILFQHHENLNHSFEELEGKTKEELIKIIDSLYYFDFL